MQEAFLVNPPQRRRRFFGNAPKKGGKRRKLYGAAAAAHAKRVGGGTRKRKKAVTAGAARHRRKSFSYAKSKRHQVVVYRTSPKRWSRSPRSRSRRRGIKINPYMTVAGANPRHYRRGYRRNPARMGGPFDLMKNMPYVFTGALSATAQTVVPPMLPATFQAPLMRFGVQAAIAVGGGMLVNQVVKDKTHGTVWMITGGAIILADVIKTYVLPMIPGLSDYEVSDYSGEGEAEAFEAFPGETLGRDVSDFSAFPVQAVAF